MRHLIVPDSDIIEAIGFEPHGLLGVMEVVFKSASDVVYRYEGVAAYDFNKLIAAESIGKTFHAMFKKTKHPFTKSERPTLKK